jgi:microcystin-dependent protein
MPKLYNLARMTTATTGTGTVTLAAAVAGYLSFADAGALNGEELYYAIKDGSNSEIGRGTYGSTGPTLTRDTVYRSTNAGAKIGLSGTAEVFVTPPAEFLRGVVPVGVILPYGGIIVPPFCLAPFGQNVSRTTYADLFSAYGTTYGAGDGSTTFGVPDLRGRVIAGQDDMGGTSANRLTGASGGVDGDVLGGTGGAETHTLTVTQMPSHVHQIANRSAPGAGGADGAVNNVALGNPINTTATGGDGAHNNVQPTLVLNYIIYAGA